MPEDRRIPAASRSADAPALPAARGPLSEFLVGRLQRSPHGLSSAPTGADDPLYGDDSQLALYLCYELHYRGLAGVDEDWEWEPSLLEFRRNLEQAYVRRLRDAVGEVAQHSDVPARLVEIVGAGSGPSLSRHLAEDATLQQVLEFSIHRSAYQLKEADPHTWAIPRLAGPAKAALVEIQADEYGQGVERDMHSVLFAMNLAELGLDPTYGAYLDVLPGPTLSPVNLVSLFGLHRRWRGALIGHLAVFEMTSVEPMGRYSAALRRLGFGPWARLFYDTHVVADAHHQVVAARDLAGGFVRAEPQLAQDVLFGAEAIMTVEANFTRHVLDAWSDARSSLRSPTEAGLRQAS